MNRRGKLWLVAVVAWLACAGAGAQQCPREDAHGSYPSAVRTLAGQLYFHDDGRRWFELRLERATCGVQAVQLTSTRGDWAELAGLHGCSVRVEGALERSTTGYYTLDAFLDVRRIQPLAGCTRQPSYEEGKRQHPDPTVDNYNVELEFHYDQPGHPVDPRVTVGGTPLTPWQAYASYWISANRAIYGHCAEGYFIDAVYGPESAHPAHFGEKMDASDLASFHPDSFLATGATDLSVGFTCHRRY